MQKGDQNGLTEQEINKFMKEAMTQANKAIECDQVPVGCIFVSKNEKSEWQIVAGSHNLTNKHQNATRHCQINCMHEMKSLSVYQRQNLILFVTVEPCIMCAYALNIFKIKHVYFGQFNDKFGGCGSVMKCNEFPFIGGIMQKQSYELIKGFYERGNQRLSEEMRNKKRKKLNQ